MKKRVLPLLTALCLMVGALAVPAGADGPFQMSPPPMTAAQGEAILEMIDRYTAAAPELSEGFAPEGIVTTQVHALVFDAGSGTPGLFMAKGHQLTEAESLTLEDGTILYFLGEVAIWTFVDGELTRFAPMEPNESYTVNISHLEVTGGMPDGSHTESRYYSFENGALTSTTPAATFIEDCDTRGNMTYTIDGEEVTEQFFVESKNGWKFGDIASAGPGGGVEYLIRNIPLVSETVEAVKAAMVAPEPEPEPETNPNPLKVQVNEQRIYIDNDEVPYGFYMCALINEEGNATNYIRVRELATALLDTPAQFGVTWDGQVNLTRGGESDPSGTGQSSGVITYAANYEVIREDTLVNGRTVTLEGVRFTDSMGGGHTYYKLRDLGEALDFNVGWSGARGIYIETDKPYDPNN